MGKKSAKTLRASLPGGIPINMLKLPRQNGYPVPWFVARVNGVYDFRVVDPPKMVKAVKQKKCWVCGEDLGPHLAFPIGPMCLITRCISDPPSHRDCATWSIKACPFMLGERDRRPENLPPGSVLPGGIPIMRNPDCICLYVTRDYKVIKDPEGKPLFRLGDPIDLEFYRGGKRATRQDVLESIEAGCPTIEAIAKEDGPESWAGYQQAKQEAIALLPKA